MMPPITAPSELPNDFWILTAFTSLRTFTVLSGLTTALAIGIAFMEDQRGRRDLLSFDVVRSISITALGWFCVALATWLDPIRMGAAVYAPPTTMANATYLCFLIQVVGWACFLLFRWQAMRGLHPWQSRGRHSRR